MRNNIFFSLIVFFVNCNYIKNDAVFLNKTIQMEFENFFIKNNSNKSEITDFKAPVYSISIEGHDNGCQIFIIPDLNVDTCTSSGFLYYKTVPIVFYVFDADIKNLINVKRLSKEWGNFNKNLLNVDFISPYSPEIRIINLNQKGEILEVRDSYQ